MITVYSGCAGSNVIIVEHIEQPEPVQSSLPWEQRFPDANNECVYCGAEFTESNPCWNDAGCNTAHTLHIDGECKRCANIRESKRTFRPTPQHERGE